MRAAYIEELGGPDKLIVGDRPQPEVGSGRMLVRTKAAGVNPVDWKMMSTMLGQASSLPMIPGFEVAGVVEAAGAGAGFYAGDEVFASTDWSSPTTVLEWPLPS